MTANLGNLGLTIISFDQDFGSFVVPASGTANSGNVNVTLTLGPLTLVELLLLPQLDLISSEVTVSYVYYLSSNKQLLTEYVCRMQQAGIPSK